MIPSRAHAQCVVTVAADLDHDCDVDNADFQLFKACATRAGVHYNPAALPPACTLVADDQGRLPADFDRDQDIDADDFGVLQRCTAGPGVAPDVHCGTPIALAWSSIRTHGSGVGPLSLDLRPSPLPPSGVVSEPRNGVIELIRVDFSERVTAVDGTLDTNDVSVKDSNAQTFTPQTLTETMLPSGASRIELSFNPMLAGPTRYTINFAGKLRGISSHLPSGASTSCSVRALVGDIDNSGQVTQSDVDAIKAHNEQTPTLSTAIFDTNVNGHIDLIDSGLATTHLGETAP